jgi:hypothetical protein
LLLRGGENLPKSAGYKAAKAGYVEVFPEQFAEPGESLWRGRTSDQALELRAEIIDKGRRIRGSRCGKRRRGSSND